MICFAMQASRLRWLINSAAGGTPAYHSILGGYRQWTQLC